MNDGLPHSATVVSGGHQLLNQGVALHHDGRLDEAAEVYREILSQHPKDFDATHLLGVVALQQGQFDAAQRLINAAVELNPHDASALGNLGTSYLAAGQPEQAIQWFDCALRLQADSSSALVNLATALHNMGRYREAIGLLRKAYANDTNSYAVSNLLGACLLKSGEPREATELFEVATRSQPDEAEGWANLAVALSAIGQHARARECAERAVASKPHSSTAFAALAGAQFAQGRLADSVESYRQGVALPGASAQMLAAYGNVLLVSGLNDEAIVQLQRAVKLDQKNLTVRWAIAIACLKPIYGSKSDIEESRSTFAHSIDEVAKWYRSSDGINEPFNAVGAVQPFYLAYQPFNNRELLKSYGALCVEWMRTLPTEGADAIRPVLTNPSTACDRKLRIGIASAHISEHSVWNAITRGWVKQIDRNNFQVSLFHLNDTTDQETEKARRSVCDFEDQPTNVAAWVQAIRKRELDVLIYPEIGMDPLTLQLASLRLAKVQAATWGHPETTGLPTIDLFISAEALEPVYPTANYSEKLVCLPNLGVYVEPLTPVNLKVSLRSLGLPNNEPLLLCPGAPFKYSPIYDDVWVQIAKHLQKRFLHRNSGGRLVFFQSRSQMMDRQLASRLRAAFDNAGVEFDAHVSIIPMLDRSRFFGLMRKSALMLDTLGFSGFNTALQALECDLPVLAFEGDFMRGRLASAIVRRMGLPELVATTTQDFVRKAIDLAGDADRRKIIRNTIIKRRKILFHDITPVRALERLLTEATVNARTNSQLK